MIDLRVYAETVLDAVFCDAPDDHREAASKDFCASIVSVLTVLADEAAVAMRERAATHATCAFDDRSRARPDNIDWNDGHLDGTRDAAKAIRAIDPASLRSAV